MRLSIQVRSFFFALWVACGSVSLHAEAAGSVNDATVLAANAVISIWISDWNKHDAPSLGRLLTPNVKFVLVNGVLLTSRDEFVTVHSRQFAERYNTSVFAPDGAPLIAQIDLNMVLINWRWIITGVDNTDRTPGQPYHGVFTWLLINQDGTWLIRAAQNTISK